MPSMGDSMNSRITLRLEGDMGERQVRLIRRAVKQHGAEYIVQAVKEKQTYERMKCQNMHCSICGEICDNPLTTVYTHSGCYYTDA